MRHTARIGRTSFWAEAVGCAMGRRDSVLRCGEGRAGARERVPPEGEREPGRGERAPRVGDGGVGGKAEGPGEGVVPGREADPVTRERGTSYGAARRGAANGGSAQRRAQQHL